LAAEKLHSAYKKTPPHGGVFRWDLALARALTGLLTRLLSLLLPRLLAGLLTLLAGLVALIALLRLALVVLIHGNLQNKI
jgi:hypothetical protein